MGSLSTSNFNDTVKIVPSIAALLKVNHSTYGQILVQSYHSSIPFTKNLSGGGSFEIIIDADLSLHDGGVYIDPTRPFPDNWDNEQQKKDWFTSQNGKGVLFVRSNFAYTPEEFGAKGDFDILESKGTDDTKSFNALTKHHNTVRLGQKTYWLSGEFNLRTREKSINPSQRGGGLSIHGINMYLSIIYYTGPDYCVDLTTDSHGYDSLEFRSFSIKTSTGGGIKAGEGGSLTFDSFFMDGCGANFWGLCLDDGKRNGPYQTAILNCRFWANDDTYKGGAWYINDGHTFVVMNTFVSKQKKDGDICFIGNVKNIYIATITLESNPQGAKFTKQVMLVFSGHPANTYIGTIHSENLANVMIEFRTPSATRAASIENFYAWSKNTSGFGDPNVKILKVNDNSETFARPPQNLTNF